MSDTPYIFEVREDNFEQLVLDNSHQVPVVLLFMAVYSGISVNLEQAIAEYANEFAGQFIFAKVDVDEAPELVQQFDVQNVPTTFILRDGDILEAVEGMLEANEVGVLLRGLGIYRQSDELREQARQVYVQGDVNQAIALLTQAAQNDPSNPRVAMDMVQVLIDLDQLDQATALFNQLPDKHKQDEMGKQLLGQLTFKGLASKTDGLETLQARVAASAEDLQARFDLAICLVAEHAYQDAMTQLFDVYQQDAGFKEGAVKEMIVTVTNMLEANEPELSANFRRKLANLAAA